MTPDEARAAIEQAAAFAALGGTLTGEEVLDQVHAAFARYVVFTSPEAADAVTLYVAATHAQTAWQHATRMVVKSAEKLPGDEVVKVPHPVRRPSAAQTAGPGSRVGHPAAGQAGSC